MPILKNSRTRRVTAGIAFLVAIIVVAIVAPKIMSQTPAPPAPPVVSALDADNAGEISAAELKQAAAALKKLDKDRDGELAGAELQPDFGPGGAGPGGGPRNGGGFSFRALFGRNARSGGKAVDPQTLKFEDGIAAIPDYETYHKLAYRGDEVLIDTFLADLEFVKFTLNAPKTDQTQLYFINTKTHRAHMMFGRAVGLGFSENQMKGVLVYRPRLKSPSGKAGLFTFEFEPFDAYPHSMVQFCHESLIEKMPILQGQIGYYPRGQLATSQMEKDRSLYVESGLPIYQDEDLTNSDVALLPLNPGRTFGRLRVMEIDERPTSRDVVIYRSLPNEMPRVAGIITEVRQTPLSHVNLRAIQDKVPNAFVASAATSERIAPLVGKFVSYSVTANGYEIREATQKEVDRHFDKIRPAKQQTPPRDLTVRTIRSLDKIGFKDSSSVGVKAANMAAMRKFGFPAGTIPQGHAVPFYFYDEFMKHNGFYEYATTLLNDPGFRENRETQAARLQEFRSLIKQAEMPDWMMNTLQELHESFPVGSSVRCRSSTNNEDLPGFSGAGLYDSYTHRAEEGHFSKSVKQVYASMWSFRAYEERDFYRVDHFSAAMGVLVHPNFKGEIANGVAVTDDILYQTEGNYYLNTHVGEDLVTNPEQESVPEEVLLDWWESKKAQVMRRSNRREANKQILTASQTELLRQHLGRVHVKFADLYGKSLDQSGFAMEVEFKITSDSKLIVKQARPWVY
jgi:hypothetical protein